MTSAMPVQCSNQLSYEVTQLRAGQFDGLMWWAGHVRGLSCWAHVRAGHVGLMWEQVNLLGSGQLSHLNFSGSWDNCLNCPVSARIMSSVDFKHRTSYNTCFISRKGWSARELFKEDWEDTDLTEEHLASTLTRWKRKYEASRSTSMSGWI